MTVKEQMKSTLVQLARARGYALTPDWKLAAQPLVRHLKELLQLYRIDCVLDVGGNSGQFHDLIREDVGFTGPIVSFEPVARYVAILEERARQDAHWHICRYALGSAAGTATINVTKSPGLNSFLPPRGDVVEGYWFDDSIVARETVQIRTLDSVIGKLQAEIGFSRPYLKLDTQGFDLQALQGAEQTLGWVCGYQTEASIRPIYEGMPTYQESIAFGNARGFELSGLFPVGTDAALRLVEFDCVMVNNRFAEALATPA